MANATKDTWVPMFALALLTSIAYLPSISNQFLWEDESGCLDYVLASNGLYRAWFSDRQPNYWPVYFTSLWLDRHLWGHDAVVYRCMNILIHTGCALLIWRTLGQLKIPGAWVAAAVFALHPVNIETAAWIIQRKTLLPMFFFLVALSAFLHFDHIGGRRWYFLSVVAFLLAMLSKGSVVGLPLILLLCIWWRRNSVQSRDIALSLPFFVIALVMSCVEIWFQSNRAIGSTDIGSSNILQRITGVGWNLWFYIYKALLPLNLSLIYPRWNIEAMSWLAYIPDLLFAGCLVVFWRFRKSWGRPFLFAFLFYGIMLGPVLGLVDIHFFKYSFVADHYQYVAIAAIIALAVGLANALLSRGGPWGNRLKLWITVLLLGTLTGLTWSRCHVFRTEETLWSDALEKNPGCWCANHNLGTHYYLRGRADAAIPLLEEAARVEPKNEFTLANLGSSFVALGRFSEADRHFERAVELNLDSGLIYYRWGLSAQYQGKIDEAIARFKKAVALDPKFLTDINEVALVILAAGQPEQALKHLKAAAEMDSTFELTHYNLGRVYMNLGRLDEATKSYHSALKISPDYTPAHTDLGVLFERQRKLDLAIDHFSTVVRIAPHDSMARLNLARVLRKKGLFKEAQIQYDEAARLANDSQRD